MNREDIIAMARKVGLWPAVTDIFPSELERFAQLVAQAERENFCAFLRQAYDAYVLQSDSTALRERGNK